MDEGASNEDINDGQRVGDHTVDVSILNGTLECGILT